FGQQNRPIGGIPSAEISEANNDRSESCRCRIAEHHPHRRGDAETGTTASEASARRQYRCDGEYRSCSLHSYVHCRTQSNAGSNTNDVPSTGGGESSTTAIIDVRLSSSRLHL